MRPHPLRLLAALALVAVVAAACAGDDTGSRGEDLGADDLDPATESLGCGGFGPADVEDVLGVTGTAVAADSSAEGCVITGGDGTNVVEFLVRREASPDAASAQLARHVDFEVGVLSATPQRLSVGEEAHHFPDAGAENVVLARQGTLWVELRAPVGDVASAEAMVERVFQRLG